ncbi:MAG: hypothetical protein Q7K57_25455 [Burkholderiaceae bacterium]|nr:hypothetical protein [Burkholderiaceae bacterium]
MPISPRIDLRPGIHEPALLMISRRQVEKHDMASVLKELRVLTATREDCWLYRNQMCLVVDGYDADHRELIDIPEVRIFLRDFAKEWPYWTFFFNLVDQSISLLISSSCGSEYPGGGQVAIDVDRLGQFMMDGFDGLNELFEKFGFPDTELMQMTDNVVEYIQQAGMK